MTPLSWWNCNIIHWQHWFCLDILPYTRPHCDDKDDDIDGDDDDDDEEEDDDVDDDDEDYNDDDVDDDDGDNQYLANKFSLPLQPP